MVKKFYNNRNYQNESKMSKYQTVIILDCIFVMVDFIYNEVYRLRFELVTTRVSILGDDTAQR